VAGVASVKLILAALLLAGAWPLPAQQAGNAAVQQPAPPSAPPSVNSRPYPFPNQPNTLPIAEDRGQAAVEQSLLRLKTTASAMMIVALRTTRTARLLTYLSRGLGARTTLFT